MANQDVQYTLSLKDLFTSKIKGADVAAKGLLFTMKDLAVMAGGAFAAIGIGNFLQSSVEAFNESDKAAAQLNATLQSTGFAAGLTKDALDAQAESLMRVSTFDDDAITGAQSLLLTFTNIKDAVFNDAIPAIADLATKMGTDLKGATMQVGKALQDPTQGMAALRRVGISFSESQQQVIKDMQDTGNLAGAQRMILAELNKEFGGSASAAAQTYSGQMQILSHEFGNVKEEIGAMVASLLIQLKPAMQLGIELFKQGVTWIKENTAVFKALAIGVGIVTSAMLINITTTKALAFWQAITNTATATGEFLQIALGNSYIITSGKTGVLAATQWALNAAMTANPIGIVIGALAALAAGIYYAWQKSETFRGTILGVWEVIKSLFNFVVQAGSGLGTYLEGIFTLDTDKIKEGAMQVASAWKDLDVSGSYQKGFEIGKNIQTGVKDGVKNGVSGVTAVAPTGTGTTPTTSVKTPKASNVTGQKSYNINISIDSLVKEFNVQTSTIGEGAQKIKDIVTQVMLSAVNDSQIIAER